MAKAYPEPSVDERSLKIPAVAEEQNKRASDRLGRKIAHPEASTLFTHLHL